LPPDKNSVAFFMPKRWEKPCFFSALGTLSRTHDEFFEEKRGNIL
jgi:hypothetical protein